MKAKAYNKNPYEIRYDLLVMAKEMADKIYKDQLDMYQKAIELQQENAEQMLEAWSKYVPLAYTPEEIKKNAEKLYDFVVSK